MLIVFQSGYKFKEFEFIGSTLKVALPTIDCFHITVVWKLVWTHRLYALKIILILLNI